MSDVKRYEITWEEFTNGPCLIVEIDPESCEFSEVFELYKFCSPEKTRLLLEDEGLKFDLVNIMLRSLAAKCFNLMLANPWGTRELLRYFEDNGFYLGDKYSNIKIIRPPCSINPSFYGMQVKDVPPHEAD
ncbi:hypothetical protein ACQSET_16980 [Salmonella enterica]|uniref:hypothetical protein n=1 Tax=Salmonella enterica TaxID=28901 RepID=UPI003D323D93|nr:hypothetical protein [Salmonella enterica]